jgi:hypothetical protein
VEVRVGDFGDGVAEVLAHRGGAGVDIVVADWAQHPLVPAEHRRGPGEVVLHAVDGPVPLLQFLVPPVRRGRGVPLLSLNDPPLLYCRLAEAFLMLKSAPPVFIAAPLVPVQVE